MGGRNVVLQVIIQTVGDAVTAYHSDCSICLQNQSRMELCFIQEAYRVSAAHII